MKHGNGAPRNSRWPRAVLALLSVGCANGCNDKPFVVNPVPDFAMAVDANIATGATCSAFQADQSGGQLKYTKKVSIKNVGAQLKAAPDPTGALCIKSLTFKSDNKQLKMLNMSGKETDEVNCKGAFAAIPQGKALNFEIEYKPNADEEDLKSGILTIETNAPNEGKIIQEFCIQSVGATVCVDSKEITFLNASAANPPVQCVYFGNCGSAPLTYKGAQFGTNNTQYSIIEEPDTGTVLPEVGHPENPKGNLKKLKVCIKYVPNSTADDEDSKLEIKTSDKATPSASVIIGAQTQVDSKYQWTCASATGKLEFNFLGHLSGVKEATCKLCNEGPAGYAPNDYNIEVFNPALSPAEIDAIYKVEAFSSPAKTPFKGQFAVSAGKCADFVVTLTYPNTGAPPPAALVVNFTQANTPGSDSIPIVVGKCDSGDFALAPETGTWLQAASGKTAQGTVIVANQGCGPFQLFNACVTGTGPVSSNPCDPDKGGMPTKYHGIVGGFSARAVLGSELVPFQVEFHPPDANKLIVNDLLHFVYCSGKWAANKCEAGSILVRTVNLVGSTMTDIVQPELTLTGPADAKVGSAVKVTASVKKGTYDDGKNYLWWVFKRPFGSSTATSSLTWWASNQQTTSAPAQTFVPDLPGTYVIAAMSQAIQEADAGNYAWSPQQTVTIVVK